MSNAQSFYPSKHRKGKKEILETFILRCPQTAVYTTRRFLSQTVIKKFSRPYLKISTKCREPRAISLRISRSCSLEKISTQERQPRNFENSSLEETL